MKYSANIVSKRVLSALLLLLVSGQLIEAAQLDLTVATDKSWYLPGEDITVSVAAYNPNDYEVTLTFGSSHQASYIMDDVYDWASERMFTTAITQVTIAPDSSHTWNFNHDWEYTFRGYTYGYDLSIGTHSVVGALQPNGIGDYAYYSPALEFEVVAAPPPIMGDFDDDGDVDAVDFGLWQAGHLTASGGSLGDGDADGDGDVDGVDFGIWQANYLTAAPTPLPSVPEPATLGVFLIGGLALFRRKLR